MSRGGGRRGSRGAGRASAALAGAALAALAAGGEGAAALAPGPGASPTPGPAARPVAADTSGLASGPWARMRTLLEKTLFQVNVAELTLRYDSAAAARVRELAAGREYSAPVADSVARAVIGARRVRGRLEFRRDVGLGRFLESLRRNMEKARDAGILADSAYRDYRGRLRDWYAALEGRGMREGDVTEYRIRGDSLRVLVRSGDGEVLIDRLDVGEQHRRAVLGGYLAPGTDFREGLVKSVFRGG